VSRLTEGDSLWPFVLRRKRLRIIGIDPGSLTAGYGVIEVKRNTLKAIAFGTIRAPKGADFPHRLKAIYEGLIEVIRRTAPDEAAIEEVFVGKSARSAMRSGEGRGVAILAAASEGLPVSEYAATLIKRSVTGYGAAHKSQVQEMVKVILGLSRLPRPEDASDALACAICHAHRCRKDMQKTTGGLERFNGKTGRR